MCVLLDINHVSSISSIHGDFYHFDLKLVYISMLHRNAEHALTTNNFFTKLNSLRNIGTYFTGPGTWGEDGSLLAKDQV